MKFIMDTTVKGSRFPSTEIFHELRARWQKKYSGNNSRFAEFCGVQPQRTSNYCNGSGKNNPPLWMIMMVAASVDAKIEIRPDAVEILDA